MLTLDPRESKEGVRMFAVFSRSTHPPPGAGGEQQVAVDPGGAQRLWEAEG